MQEVTVVSLETELGNDVQSQDAVLCCKVDCNNPRRSLHKKLSSEIYTFKMKQCDYSTGILDTLITVSRTGNEVQLLPYSDTFRTRQYWLSRFSACHEYPQEKNTVC